MGFLGRLRALLTGAGTSITECGSFGCSTYTLEISNVTNNGDGTVTVEWTRSREDTDHGLIGEVTIDVIVAGQRIGGESTTPASSEVSKTVTGPGAAGDTVTARLTTFKDNVRETTATVPAVDGGGDGSDDGDGTDGVPVHQRSGVKVAGALVAGGAIGVVTSRFD